MKRILALLLTALMLLTLMSCTKSPEQPVDTTAAATTGGTTPPPENEPVELRVMTFNIQQELGKWSSVISADTRVKAVIQNILDYEPSLVGLQEDGSAALGDVWESHLNEGLTGYTVYNSYAELKEGRIYVKNELVPYVVDHGNMRLTRGLQRTSVALVMSDLTDKNSPYYMTDAELEFLQLATKQSDGSYQYASDSALRTTHKSYSQYTNAQHTAWKQVTGDIMLIERRSMNYIVMQFGDRHVIYVNTHLCHRAQNAAYNGYFNDADKETYNSPVQKLRSFERAKSVEIIMEEVAKLQEKYPGAQLIITGDMNDTPEVRGSESTLTEVYKAFTVTYNLEDTAVAAKRAGAFVGDEGTWNNSVTTQTRKTNGDRLDYCFISKSENFKVVKHNNTRGSTYLDGKTYFTSDHCPVVVDLYLN